jgi:hypothetical protein
MEVSEVVLPNVLQQLESYFLLFPPAWSLSSHVLSWDHSCHQGYANSKKPLFDTAQTLNSVGIGFPGTAEPL